MIETKIPEMQVKNGNLIINDEYYKVKIMEVKYLPDEIYSSVEIVIHARK